MPVGVTHPVKTRAFIWLVKEPLTTSVYFCGVGFFHFKEQWSVEVVQLARKEYFFYLIFTCIECSSYHSFPKCKAV